MGNLKHSFMMALLNIKRAPIPYFLTLLVMSVGLGMFFSNAALYYWLNNDPIPEKSSALFYPQINSVNRPCSSCRSAPQVLSYKDIQLLSNTTIPSAQAAMFQSAGYARIPSKEHNPPTPVSLRVTQRDFFELFNVPFLHGSRWPDDSNRRELILSKKTAEQFFGKTNAVGESLQLGSDIFTVVGVLDDWAMLPRLYDVANGYGISAKTEDIFVPWETAYDLGIKSNTQTMSADSIDYSQKFSERGRIGEFYQAQFWVQLDDEQKVAEYKRYMQQLVESEKEAGRHPRQEANSLTNILNIAEHFNARNHQLDAFAIVSMLFLIVCLFNASHLTLNRYLSSQYEFGLRRALGASRIQLQQLVLADVFVNSALSLLLSLLVAFCATKLINNLLPATINLSGWNLLMVMSMASATLVANYVVTLYPSFKASFGNLSSQIK